MSVTLLKDEKLEKHYRVKIPAADITKSINNEIARIAPTVKIQGFRPGKVPLSIIQKKYGSSVRIDVINDLVRESVDKIIKDKKYKTFTNPTLEDVSEEEGKDLEFTAKIFLYPEFKMPDFKKMKLEKPVLKITEKELESKLSDVAQANKKYDTPSKTAAKKDDLVTIDFVGYVDGKEFEGGAMKGHKLLLGSGAFIPGFEDQLIGAKAGQEVTVSVTFPKEYHAKDLAGKKAEFKVTVHEVNKSSVPEINEDFAKSMGLKNLEELKSRVQEMVASSYNNEILTMLKMQLFDIFEKELDFEVPQEMLSREMEMIKAQDNNESDTKDKKSKTDKDLDKVYHRLALRRVRIGIMLADYAMQNNIQLNQNDIKDAILAQARNFPGQEQLIIDYYVKNKQAIESLKGPILEDKSVKAILDSEIKLATKEYSLKDLEKLIDENNSRDIT